MIISNRSQLFPHICAAAVIFAAVLAIPGKASAAIQVETSKQQVAIIQVTGTGSIAIAPDIAIINMGVVRQAETARKALDANSSAMADVISAMKKQDIADKDLQTSGFNIQPLYQYFKATKSGEQKPPKIIGYQVSNKLTVRIRDLKKVGTMLDLAVTLGMNDGGNIQFTNDNPEQALSQARTKAMENAIKKATTLTSAAGVKLGRILKISEQSHSPRPVAMGRVRMMAAKAESAVPIQGGENTYRIDVSVSWEIAQ